MSPHHLASSAGLEILAAGGNALDAAVAANLALGVVAPYTCGYGGDLFAIVFDGTFHGYNGSGRSSGRATLERVRDLVAPEGRDEQYLAIPERGPLPITVPGAVEAWFALLARFGTFSFDRLSRRALSYAEDGVPLSARAVGRIERAALHHRDGEPSFAEWRSVYCPAATSRMLVQPGLARTIRALCEGGPDEFYRGSITSPMVSCIASLGGLLDLSDFGTHEGEWVEPLRQRYRGVEVVELPPNSQGIVALEALGILEATGELPEDGLCRQHLMIEATKLALSDRVEITDPGAMRTTAAELLDRGRLAGLGKHIDKARAGRPPPAQPAPSGTAYIAAADGDGMCVSLIQSNYLGFGSGVTVPHFGVNLNNRGWFFSLDPSHANVVAPRKRPMHTLMPAMIVREGRPSHLFGAMGGDGQAQVHVQLATRIVDDGSDPEQVVGAPRWIADLRDWSLTLESRFGDEIPEGLRSLGHDVTVTGEWDDLMGHAHVLAVEPDRIVGAADPRCEGAAAGF